MLSHIKLRASSYAFDTDKAALGFVIKSSLARDDRSIEHLRKIAQHVMDDIIRSF